MLQTVAATKVNAMIPQGLKVTISKPLYEQIIESVRYVRKLASTTSALE